MGEGRCEGAFGRDGVEIWAMRVADEWNGCRDAVVGNDLSTASLLSSTFSSSGTVSFPVLFLTAVDGDFFVLFIHLSSLLLAVISLLLDLRFCPLCFAHEFPHFHQSLPYTVTHGWVV